MQREKFESLVAKALEQLPLEFQSKMENIDVVVENWPTKEQLSRVKLRSPTQLLGLYEGVPKTRRGGGYGLVPPDKITIFQKPIEARRHPDKQIETEIQKVVCHEIAHHFGSTEESLRRIESERLRKISRLR